MFYICSKSSVMSNDYLSKYKEILELEGLTGFDVCNLLGLNYGSYRVSTRKNAKVCPLWVKMFVMGYKIGDGNSEKTTASQ